MATITNSKVYLVAPETGSVEHVRTVIGVDQLNRSQSLDIITEVPLTIFLNRREIVTTITIGDHPKWLAVGFLFNQGILGVNDAITAIDYDAELQTVVVRTDVVTEFEHKEQRKVRTSGCAVGTIYEAMMTKAKTIKFGKTPPIKQSALYRLSHTINRTPSLYLQAGAIHGTVLCRGDQPLVYIEDVGRHNAVDKIAGWLYQNKKTSEADQFILYTTGRLTSEMVLKSIMMGIPILVSRSGFTELAVNIAQEANLTLIGRLRGQRFICLSSTGRIIFDQNEANHSHDLD